MNKGFASGFISSDIKSETINTKNGEMRKIKFSIACNRKVKGEADFPWFEAIGKTAETIERYLTKGKGIYVEYHISTGKYTNKEGKTVYTSTNLIDSFEFPPVRRDEETSPVSDASYENQDNDTHTEDNSEPPKQPESEFMSIPDDIDDGIGELPFR